MSTITIYNIKTGLAVSCGSAGIVVPDGCVAVQGLHDLRRTQLVVVVDDFGGETYQVGPRLPPRPVDSYLTVWEWSETVDAWMPVLTMSGHKVARWEMVKAWRDRAELTPLTVGRHVYDADQDSQRRIAGAVQLAMLAPAIWAIDWTLADNTVITLTAAQIIAVGVALGAQVSAAHATARVLRAQIDAAESVRELNAITWPDAIGSL